MLQRLQYFYLSCFLALLSFSVKAQNTITTQPLTISGICPGSVLDVPFTLTGTYPTANVFTVQLSNGGDYTNITTSGASYNNATGRYTISATIPTGTAAGTTYKVRVTASNPAVIGSPSSTQFAVKIKPGAPEMANKTQCQQFCRSAATCSYLLSSATAPGPGASLQWYNPQGNPYTPLSYSTTSTIDIGVDQSGWSIGTNTLFVSRVADGCESDRTPFTLTLNPNQEFGPGNYDGNAFAVCQNSGTYTLDRFVGPPPANYRNYYYDAQGFGTTVAPVISTSAVAVYSFAAAYISDKGCIGPKRTNGTIYARVNPTPVSPTLTTKTLTYCQNQASTPLIATTNVAGASIAWYTAATGGTASAAAPQPLTTQAGTFKYYAAQVLNNCESDRAEITVEVKAGSPNPTPTGASYCIGQQTVAVSAVAASGGSLLWYAAATGGNGSQVAPTPSTGTANTQTFYVSQTVGTNCESQRVPLIVTVNGLPSAPVINQTAVSACQNTTANALIASGTNLKWYDVASGGTGVSTLRPTTDALGTKTYYVSQTDKGCEGPRSSVIVSVKGRPGVPKVDSVQRICDPTPSAMSQASSITLNFTVVAGASASLYTADGRPAGGYYSTTGGGPFSFRYGDFQRPTGTSSSATVEQSFYVTQTVDGCESDKVQTKIRTLYWPKGGPTPANQYSAQYGQIAYCQGETALPLNVKGVGPALENYRITYQPNGANSFSTDPPTPSTTNTGRTTYALRYAVIDPTKSCTPIYSIYAPNVETYLYVDVNAKPGKPALSNASSKTYCQNQTADVLTATADANASLAWYGTNATSGTATASAPRPATNQAGTFRYYVAQSLNGCEGDRAEITVVVKAAVTQPTVTGTVTYCQNQITAPLNATGTQLRWVLPTNQTVTDAPSPSAQTPGTVSYFVTQTVDGCESDRAEIKVTTKRTPDAPSTSAVAICQNETVPALSANGQNLLWYAANAGGTGTATTPVVNAGQSGQATYYVSQSLDGCEGPRAGLSVTVKALPAAPGVTKVDLCQFAKASPLVATGSGTLTWYDVDGKAIGSTGPTPATDKGATLPYQVSQTTDGCISSKATLVVTVGATPAPILPKTILELCKGSTAAPLEATGTNLKWTDPTGAVTTTAPIPYTTEPTKNPDGDAYYVTQTGSNNCESPRAVIRVFVQGPPTLSLSGGTTVNLGMEAPIALKFTGVGPYQYKITTGVGQPFSGSAIKDTSILVLPSRTTIYQVMEVSNRCGVGLPVSTATVTVTVPTIQTQTLASATVCAGTTLTTNFSTTGTFNPGSVFKTQFARTDADSTKIQYTDLPNAQTTGGLITAQIPTTATSGTYLVRVVATNPKYPILGMASSTTLTVRQLPTATLTASSASVFETETVKLSVAFGGDGPWQFSYRDSSSVANTVREVSTNANPHVLDLKPTKSTVYRLTSLSNGCGISLALPAPTAVTVNALLAVEPLAGQITIFPIPTAGSLTVRITPAALTKSATLRVVDLMGHVVLAQETNQPTTTLNLSGQAAGHYVLTVQIGTTIVSQRVLKL